MNEKMTLLFVKETGHVLAAITRAADAEAKIEASALAGTALPVRYVGDPAGTGYSETVLVPAGQLDTFTADYEARALQRPNDYFVAGKDDQQKSQQANRFITVTGAPQSGNSQLKIDANVPDKTKVLVILSGSTPADTQLVSGEMIYDAGLTKSIAILNIAQLNPGDYTLLILVVGVWPRTEKITVN
jgi:hypothetical protein